MQIIPLRSRVVTLVLVCLVLLGISARAQVAASLVATETSVQPGHPLQAALRLVHEPHWHTYWINAGTGYPTKLTWQLPEGWTASEINWPVPTIIKDHAGNVTGNGYDGEMLLPVTLTPPKTLPIGTPVKFKAKAEWLMCSETCVPGSADISLTLPVSNETPQTNAQWKTALSQIPFPKPTTGWKISATQSGKSILLTLSGNPTPLPNPHFFSTDGLVQ